MVKKILFSLFAVLITAAASAQTALPYSTSFEDPDDVAEWTFTDGSTGGWYVGTAAARDGEFSLYVSNDGGATNDYANSMMVHAYRTFTFAEGEYKISFDWLCMGESSYDYMKVYLVPATTVLGTGAAVPTEGAIELTNTSSKAYYNQQADWTTKEANVTIATAGDYKLVFYWRSDGSATNSPSATVDNLSIVQITCVLVKGFALPSLGTTGATVSWNAIATAEGYDYILQPASAAMDETLAQSTTATQVSLTGLTANTAYTFYVRQQCGEGAAGDWNSFDFRTDCAAITALPWTESFENETTDALPACWRGINLATANYTYPKAYVNNDANYVKTGSKSLYFQSGKARQAVVIFPMIDTDLSNAEINFYYRNEGVGTTNGTLSVGYVTDIADSASFVALRTLARTTVMTEVVQPLSSVPAGAHLAFSYMGGTSQNYYLGIDDIVVRETPTCLRPNNVVVGEVTTTTAKLSWTSESEPAEHYVLVKNVGTELYNGIVSGSELTLTGLTPATKYTDLSVSVVAKCSATEVSDTLKTTVSFSTDCDPVAALPWSCNFETAASGDVPVCWTAPGQYTSTYSTYPSVANSVYASHGGNQYLSFFGGTSTYGNEIAVLPAFDFDINTAQLILWYKCGYAGTDYATLEIGVMSDPADPTTFQLLKTLPQVTTYTEAKQKITAPEGYNYIALRFPATATLATSCTVDDIQLVVKPACAEPADISVDETSITATSAKLTWSHEEDAPEYALLVKNGSETLLPWTTVQAKEYTLQGLTPSSNYSLTVSVVALCDAEHHSDTVSSTVAFPTACEVITAFPWIVDFEALPEMAANDIACWSTVQVTPGSGNGSTNQGFKTTTDKGRDASHGIQLPDMRAGEITRMTLPDMNIPAADAYEFKIDVNRTATGTTAMAEGVRIFVGETELGFISRNHTVADAAHGVQAESAAGWYTYSFTLPVSGTTNIIIQGESQYGTATYMDNFVVREIPSCMPASNLRVLDALTTTTSVSFGWTPYSADNRNAHVIVKNGTQVLYDTTVNDSVFTISGLTAATSYTYSVDVYTVCDASEAVDVLHGDLTLQTDCEAITTFPWTEDFNSLQSGIPACWDNSEGTTTNDNYRWQRYTGGSEKMMRFNSCFNPSGKTNLLASAPVALPEDANMIISFDWKNPTGGNYQFYISTDGGTTLGEAVKDNMTGQSEWQTEELSLSAYKGQTVTFVWKGTSNFGNGDAYLYLDNVHVGAPTTCIKPNQVTADNVTGTSAEIHWVSDAALGDSIIVKNGTETLATAFSTTDMFLLENLSPATAYNLTVELKGICSADDASQVYTTSVSFSTECDEVTAFPWTCDFESFASGSIATVAPCFGQEKTTGANNWECYMSTSSHAGSFSARCFYSNSSAGYTYSSMVLPEFAFEAGKTYEISLWVKGSLSAATDSLILTLDGETPTRILAINAGQKSAGQWLKVSAWFTADAPSTLSITYGNNDGYSLYVDDITVKEATYKLVLDGETYEFAATADEGVYVYNTTQKIPAASNHSVLVTFGDTQYGGEDITRTNSTVTLYEGVGVCWMESDTNDAYYGFTLTVSGENLTLAVDYSGQWPTGLGEVDADVVQKFILDGHLYIRKQGRIYNAQGILVE